MNIGIVLFTNLTVGGGTDQVAKNLARTIESIDDSCNVYVFQTNFYGPFQKDNPILPQISSNAKIVTLRSPYNNQLWRIAVKHPLLNFFYANFIYHFLYIVMNQKTIKNYVGKLDHIVFLWYRDVIPWRIISSEVLKKSVASGDCGLVNPKKGAINRIFLSFLLQCTRRFRYLNKNQMELHLTSSDHELYLPNGVDTSKFTILPDSNREIKNYLFVGRLVKEKGIREFIEAAKILKNEKWLKFTIAGKGEYTQEVSTLSSVQKNVEYLGFLEEDELSELYKKSDVLILPSYSETFGNVVLEAISSGVFCMVSESLRGNFDELEKIGALEYIENTETSIADAIRRSKYFSVSTKTQNIWHTYIENNYSWISISKRLLQFLNSSLIN